MDVMLVFDAVVALFGAYMIGSALHMKKSGRINSMVLAQEELKKVKDTKGFIEFLYWRGMLFGALWAKEAWGHYWSWDPKETWAAATWLGYLCYIHFRMNRRQKVRTALVGLLICFVLLQMCWYGINYLPSAQGTSVHTYNLN